jgi:hypothetical protein
MTYRLLFPHFLTILAKFTLPNINYPASPQDCRAPAPRFLAAASNALLHFLRRAYRGTKDASCPHLPVWISSILIPC